MGSKVKERLTGAIILVALIVLLVPELLTGPIGSAPRAAAVAPSPEEPPLRSYTINLADDTHSRSAAVITSGPQQPTPLSAAQPAAAESRPPAAASAAPRAPQAPPAAPPLLPAKSAPASAAASSAANSAAEGSWMVQLGSFASRTNAERLARQVKAGGFKVSVSQGSSGRRLFRVRVGPAHDREAATQLAAKLQAAGHSGAIVPK
ncbi:MAG TPA: SPOR domain-containing protein [Steroidobacteraceae bacterium]|nr:SPOR domain-containing protein [Steroidobacteraceae bacterium]